VLLSPYWQLLLRRVAEEATVLGLEQHTHQHNHQEDGGGRGGDARAPTTAAGLPFCVCLSVCSLCVHLCVLAWLPFEAADGRRLGLAAGVAGRGG
jgi:hypothetical protein